MSETIGAKQRDVQVWSADQLQQNSDAIAEEVPVAMVFNGVSHVVMMASPNQLEVFAIGFSLTEGIVEHVDEVYDIRVSPGQDGIELELTIANQRFSELKEKRRNLTGRTGCGICGAESLQNVRLELSPVSSRFMPGHLAINAAASGLSQKQPLQDSTGAVHGAAWCDSAGNILELCEDVGRHNALDKLLGSMAQKDLLSSEYLNTGFVIVSSRASYEMVQKVAMLNIAALVAVSAATTLAIDVAKELGVNLIGFARENRHVLYVENKEVDKA